MGGYIRDGRYANRVGWCILGEKLDKERERERERERVEGKYKLGRKE